MGCCASRTHPSPLPALDPVALQASLVAIAAEVARVKALSDDERASIGSKYTDPEQLWQALEAGAGNATLILRASWLKAQRVKVGFRIPKRGDQLPTEAAITVPELRAIAKASLCLYALPVISLSHFWRTKEHPDPDGETAELVIASLEKRWAEFESRGVTDLGVIIDFSSLWQAPRETPEKVSAFQEGLKGINQWYAHKGTTVWLITAGADRVNGLSYWDKGWTSFEFALSMLIKPANTTSFKDWAQVVDLGKDGAAQTRFARPPLAEPLAFFGGHAYGAKTYTNGADRDAIVAPKFRETMFEIMGGVRELDFANLKWGYDGVMALGVVLPLCAQLTKLDLGGNDCGDAGMKAVAGACASGALAQCQELFLDGNLIGDDGMTAFAQAIKPVSEGGSGALSKLETLRLGGNRISDLGMTAFAQAIRPISEGGSGALAQLTELNLGRNQIGDVGMTAFAQAIKPVSEGGSGALARCQLLKLSNNKIGDAGITALAQAVKPVSAGGSGALPLLQKLYLQRNQIGHVGMTAFAQVIKPVSAGGSGALSQLEVLVLDGNQIGDVGCSALADVCARGALSNLERLNLASNKIGDAGITALATSVGSGALPVCTCIAVGRNPASAEAQQAVEDAIKNRQ